MLIGQIDEVDGRHVSTDFAFLGGPLFPKRSWYVTGVSVSPSGNRSTDSWTGRRLPLQWYSVLLGYLRIWSFWLALAMPFILMWGEDVDFSRPEYLVAVGLLVFWLLVLFLPGRLSRKAKAQLRVLARSTQLMLDPKRLPAHDRDFILKDLAKELQLLDVPTDTPAVLLDRLGELEPADQEILYTYARYRSVKEPAWRNTADTIWQRLPQADA